MGTFTFCSKFERAGKPENAADSRWNLIGQGGHGNSIRYFDTQKRQCDKVYFGALIKEL